MFLHKKEKKSSHIMHNLMHETERERGSERERDIPEQLCATAVLFEEQSKPFLAKK